MLPGLSVVIGGVASGASVFAENMVLSTGRTPVALLTAKPGDPAMDARLARRQAAQDANWQVIEGPLDIGRTLAGISGDTAVLLDGLPAWLFNQVEAGNDLNEAEAELMAGLALCSAPVVVLTGEPALSAEYDAPFCAAQGTLNQKLALKAGLVVNVIAGLPQVLKGALP